MSEELTEIARTVEQASKKAAEMTKPTTPVGGVVGVHEVDAVLAGNEAYVLSKEMAGAGAGSGSNTETQRQGNIQSWSVYWDVDSKKYKFHSPYVMLPNGGLVSVPTIDVDSNNTYYAHIWYKDEKWNTEITKEKTSKGGKPESWITIAVIGDLDKPGNVKQVHTGVITVPGSGGGDSRPKPFDLSIEEEEVEIGEEKGSVSVPKFTNTVYFFNGEERSDCKINVGALSGGETIYLQMKRKVNVDEDSGAKTYEAWEVSLETSLEPETNELQVIGIVLYKIGTGEKGRAIIELDKRDASIDLGKVVQTDGCSVEENTDGSLQISGFTSSPAPSEMTTLAAALTADAAKDARVLVQKDGKVGYLPIGNGIDGGTGPDDVSIGLNDESKFEIKGFKSGDEEGYTLADKLAIEKDDAGQPKEQYDGQVLVRISGRLVYVPVGCGLGKGEGGEITVVGTDGTEAKGSKIIFEAEDNTNITFKASANNGVVTVKVGVYYRSGSR